MKNIIYLSITFISMFLFFSCQKEPNVDVSKYELDKKSVHEKITSGVKGIGEPASSMQSLDCAIPFTSNCIRYNEEIELNIDISDCSSSVTDNCLVVGSMQVTICTYQRRIIVDFVEDVIGHYNDCIVNSDEHTDDWDCIHEKFYQAYIAYMMPMILDEYEQFSQCGDFNNTFLSRYKKELCTYPCTIYIKGLPYSKLIQCGTSSACCVKWDQWCQEEDGTINVTPGDKYQIGSCNFSGTPPCPKTKGEPYPFPASCTPRSCLPIPLPR